MNLLLLAMMCFNDLDDLKASLRVEEPQPVVKSQPAVAQPTKRREWYLVSDPYCKHCPAAKREFERKGWPKENILSVDECERRFGFRPPHLPFEFGDPAWKSPSVPAAGASSSSGQSKACNCTKLCACGCNQERECKCRAAAASSARSSVMSHNDMVSLHNRLHGGGSHPWPGDLRTHLRQSHGVAIE